MTTSLVSNAGSSEPMIREPAPAEVERVLHLFGNAPLGPGARLLAAARSRPLERFVAAAAWWTEGALGQFRLACQPGVARTQAGGWLIAPLLAAVGRSGIKTVQYADLLPDQNEWPAILRQHGFERWRSERSFEVAYRDAWTRVMRLHQKHLSEIPSDWRTEPIRQHTPEVILDLIAPHRLMPPAEVRHFWRANAAAGFDLDLSCILFARERPFGAFLARRLGEVIYIDVQVVQEPNPRLRSLGDLCLLYHDAQRVQPDGPIRWIQFRSGQTEHRQTANLALRMGGRELPPRHVFARQL